MAIQNYLALSVVAPSGQKIRNCEKTIEVRKWLPPHLPMRNLLIVENQHYLLQDGDEEQGITVALVDIATAHPWREDEVASACANDWQQGYFAWEISNVRPLSTISVLAKRKLYHLDVDLSK